MSIQGMWIATLMRTALVALWQLLWAIPPESARSCLVSCQDPYKLSRLVAPMGRTKGMVLHPNEWPPDSDGCWVAAKGDGHLWRTNRRS
jgi:hypothetical protein